MLEASVITLGVLWADKWEYILVSFNADWAPVIRVDGTNYLGYDLIWLISDVIPSSCFSESLYMEFSFEM